MAVNELSRTGVVSSSVMCGRKQVAVINPKYTSQNGGIAILKNTRMEFVEDWKDASPGVADVIRYVFHVG